MSGTAICPYCDIEVKMSAVDAEDGHCPECGAIFTPSLIFGPDAESDIDDLDDLDEDEDDLDIEEDDIELIDDEDEEF